MCVCVCVCVRIIISHFSLVPSLGTSPTVWPGNEANYVSAVQMTT